MIFYDSSIYAFTQCVQYKFNQYALVTGVRQCSIRFLLQYLYLQDVNFQALFLLLTIYYFYSVHKYICLYINAMIFLEGITWENMRYYFNVAILMHCLISISDLILILYPAVLLPSPCLTHPLPAVAFQTRSTSRIQDHPLLYKIHPPHPAKHESTPTFVSRFFISFITESGATD